MRTSTAIATSLCTTLGLVYGAIQIPAFLGSLSMINSYKECVDASMALTPEALVKDSANAQKEFASGCSGLQVKGEIASKVVSAR